MPAFVVTENDVHTFKDVATLDRWYAKNHDKGEAIWIRIFKKGSGVPSVSNVDTLDEALCWGWIDGTRKGWDEQSFIQRYSPRKKASTWSKINIGHVERLRKQGRMRPAGEAEVERAKADGRWAKAYGDFKNDDFPADLLAAIKAEPKALKLFEQLSAQNRFSLAFRTHKMKTPEGRRKKIEGFVEMLKRGETIYPQKAGK